MMSSSAELKTFQLWLEPKPPPQHTSLTNSQSPTVRRRVQSAKQRRCGKEKLKEQRPSSAVIAGEKRRVVSLSSKPPSGKNGRVVHGQTLNLDVNFGKIHEQSEFLAGCKHVGVESGEERKGDARKPMEDKEEDTQQEIPSGIAALAPWLTPDVEQQLIGVDPKTCLVFLPGLMDYSHDIQTAPTVQDASGVLPHKAVHQKQPKQFDPSKLFHYNVLKNRPHSAGHICNHKRKETVTDIQKIFGRNGKLLYDESQYQRQRTKDVIRKEIEDLERLLQGLGSEDSDNIIVQYQHEINVLQKSVKQTLSKCNRRKETSEPLPDLTGLRSYLREKQRIIQRIKDRREKCIKELEELENEFGIRVTIVPQCPQK
ncbi:hypothetical protein HOLleu_18851 [Holothuria leucospilota]|uniref:Uncharacterized protein n=1 Tax=Holothuria leucospilota TaxID=206669 RepID=A0A9Q1C4G2_HOLLE|nr:hypothetical protein HOLleu_18851 [Holothuria leucospilota]